MSLANPITRPSVVRGDIVAALASVDGITAFPSAPDQAAPGVAWPRWVQTSYDGDLAALGVDTYEILVTLPAGYAGHTVDEGDVVRDTVALVLSPLVHVLFAEPVQITFNDRQAMPGIRYRVETR